MGIRICDTGTREYKKYQKTRTWTQLGHNNFKKNYNNSYIYILNKQNVHTDRIQIEVLVQHRIQILREKNKLTKMCKVLNTRKNLRYHIYLVKFYLRENLIDP